jgi:hypothetical protein
LVLITTINTNYFKFNNQALRFLTVPCILDFTWSKNVINQVLDNFPSIFVQLPFDPHYLSVSGASGSVLIVCGVQQQRLRILCFDISDLTAVNANMQPFATIALDTKVSTDTLVQTLDWHPEYSESLVLIVLSNGALLSIGVNLGNKSAQLLATLHYQERITSVSWSPKGKQFVLGKENGQLIQLKHKNGKEFEEAKVLRPPSEYAGYAVRSLRWCFSNLFSVCYAKIDGNDLQTKFTTIFAPTKVQPTFNDHGSVCMDFYNNQQSYQANFVHFDNVLITSTTCSSELCVIGCDDSQASTEKWKQWILDDSARVELPLTKDGKDTFPRGIALFLNETKKFKISESECYGGKNCPLMLILNSAGVLCSYYIVYSKLKLNPQLPKKQLEFVLQPKAQQPIVQAVTPVGPPVQQIQKPQVAAPIPSVAPPAPAPTNVPASAPIPSNPTVTHQQTSIAPTTNAPSAVVSRSKEQDKQKQEQDEQGTYAIAIREEIVQFSTLLNKMKESCEQLRSTVKIGKPEEGKTLVTKSEQLKRLVNESREASQHLKLDLLEKMLFEDFVLAEEAKKRLDQKTDSKFKLLHSKGLTSDTLLTGKYTQIFEKRNWLEKELKKFEGETYFQNYFNLFGDRKAEGRDAETPMHLIFTTLSNNHKSIRAFEQQISHLETKLPVLSKSGDCSSNNSEISSIGQLLKQCSIDDNQRFPSVSNAANGTIVGNRVVVKHLNGDKQEALRKHLEQINSVPVLRSSLPTDVNSSLIISAVAKAEQKLKSLRKPHRLSTSSGGQPKSASQTLTSNAARAPVAVKVPSQSVKHALPHKSATTAQPVHVQPTINPMAFVPPSPLAQQAMPFIPPTLGMPPQQFQPSQAQLQELLLSQINLLQSQPNALLGLLNNYKNLGAYDPMMALNNLAALDPAMLMNSLAGSGVIPAPLPTFSVGAQPIDKTPSTIQKALQQHLSKPMPTQISEKGDLKKDSATKLKTNYEDISPPNTPLKPAPTKIEPKPNVLPVQSTPIKQDSKAPVNFSFNLLAQPHKIPSEAHVLPSDKALTAAAPFAQLSTLPVAASISSSNSNVGASSFSFNKIASVSTMATVPSSSLGVASNVIANPSAAPTVTTTSITAPVASSFAFTPQKSLTTTTTAAVPSNNNASFTLNTSTLSTPSTTVAPALSAFTSVAPAIVTPSETNVAFAAPASAAPSTPTTSQPNLSFGLGCLGGTPNPANLNKNPFGTVKFPTATPGSIFGTTQTTATSSTVSSVTTASVAVTSTTAVSTTSNTTTTASQPFAQSSVFGTSAAPQTSAFATNPSSTFGTATAFGSSTATVFGTTPTSASPFSKPATGSLFGASANTFTSQPQPTTTQSGSVFGAATPAFGTSSSAVTSTPSVPSASFSSTPATTASSNSFGASTGFGSPFNKSAQTGSIFGSGFTGNPASNSQPSTTTTSTIGATSPAPAFGAKPAFGAAPAFGSPPAFGAPPAFGSPPKFGASPAFGGSSTFGANPVFGSNSGGFAPPVSSAANSGTFGASAAPANTGFGGQVFTLIPFFRKSPI